MDLQKFGVDIYLIQVIFGAVDIPAKVVVTVSMSFLGRRLSQCGALVFAGVTILVNLLVPYGMLPVMHSRYESMSCSGWNSLYSSNSWLLTGRGGPFFLVPLCVRSLFCPMKNSSFIKIHWEIRTKKGQTFWTLLYPEFPIYISVQSFKPLQRLLTWFFFFFGSLRFWRCSGGVYIDHI